MGPAFEKAVDICCAEASGYPASETCVSWLRLYQVILKSAKPAFLIRHRIPDHSSKPRIKNPGLLPGIYCTFSLFYSLIQQLRLRKVRSIVAVYKKTAAVFYLRNKLLVNLLRYSGATFATADITSALNE